MALTANQVQQFYIGYYARPADPVSLTYWETQTEEAALAGFSASAEFTNQFTGLSTSQQVTKVYGNLLGRAPDAVGLLYWSGEITAGRETIGSLVLSMIKNAGGKDVTTIADRVTYSNAFTAAVNTVDEINAYAGPTATQAARDALLKVVSASTGDHTALTAETAKIDATITAIVSGGTSNPGQTFTLTTGLDIVNGTAGNDTILADNTGTAVTLSGADQITGGAGIDTLKIYTKAGVANTLPTSMTGVENIWINGTDQAVDVSANADVKSVELNAAIAAGTYAVTVAAGQKVAVSDQAAATTYTVTSAATVTSQDLAVSKVGTTAANIIALTGTGVTTVNLESKGTLTSTQFNTVQLKNATGVKVDTINITGAAALDLLVGSGATTEFATTGIKVINASAATGATKVKVNSGGAAGQSELNATFSYKGGTANDTLDLSAATVSASAVTAAQLKAMTIDGGTGTDTLIVSNAIGAGTTALTNLVGIENIGVAAANGTINIANFTGVTGLALSGTNGGAVTVNNLGSAGTLDLGASVQAGNALTINAVGTGTSDTLAITAGTATAALGASAGAVVINGYETATLTVQGAAATMSGGITFAASAGGNQTVNIVANKGFTESGVTTLSGATTALNISGAGDVVLSGAITAGTLTNTGTGAFTAAGANKVLNADFTANTKAVSFTDSAAASAAILKGGIGDTTFVGSAFNDVITVQGGTNNVTGGAGADVITINHGASTKATTLTMATPASDSGDAAGFAAATTVPTAAFSTTAMDIVTGFKAGDMVQLTGLTTSAALITNGGTMGAANIGSVALIKGVYSTSANTFTASATGTDSALVYDSNGDAAGGTYQAIVLVGYVDSGVSDAISTGGLFTAVA